MLLNDVPEEEKEQFWANVEEELRKMGSENPGEDTRWYLNELAMRLEKMDKAMESHREQKYTEEQKRNLPKSRVNDLNRTDLLYHLSPLEIATSIQNLRQRPRSTRDDGGAEFDFDITPGGSLVDEVRKTLGVLGLQSGPAAQQ